MVYLLNLYSDKKYSLPEQYHPLLFPFWGIPENLKNDEMSLHFSTIAAHFFRLSSIEDADYALFPTFYQWICDNPERLQDLDSFIKEAEKYHLKTIIFFTSDSAVPLKIDNTIILRNSLFKTKQHKNEYSIPQVVDDILNQYFEGELPFLKKELKPRVGFVGYAASPIRALLSRIFNLLVKKPCGKGAVSTVRYRAMKYLKRTSDIACNFILRSTFWGTLPHAATQAEQRNEFIQNIEENDYILCARGGGNFSFRFYETLCCGRIPLFVNTDCVLPFEKKIDWKKYVVWVEEEDIEHIDTILRSFHDSLDDREYHIRQAECRKLWEDHLSVKGFLHNLHDMLIEPTFRM